MILQHPIEEDLPDAALLFALLVNYQQQGQQCSAGNGGSISGGSVLAFLVDDIHEKDEKEKGNEKDKKDGEKVQRALNAMLRALYLRKDLGSSCPCTVEQHAGYDYKLEVQRLVFLNYAFQSLDVGAGSGDVAVAVVADCLMPLVGVQLYEHMSGRRRELEFALNPMLEEVWMRHTEEAVHKRKKARLVPHASMKITYVGDMIARFLDLLDVERQAMDGKDDEGGDDEDESSVDFQFSHEQLMFLYRTMELLADLLTSRQTRRWLIGLLRDQGFSVKAGFSSLCKSDNLFRQLLEVCMYHIDNFVLCDFCLSHTVFLDRWLLKLSRWWRSGRI